MTGGAETVEVRIRRLTIDGDALAGAPGAAFIARLRDSLGRRLAGGAEAPVTGPADAVAARVASEIARATAPDGGRP